MTPDESTATGTPPLRVDGLTKSFGAVRAVEDVSFTVRPGRVTGFLGPNGAGKSTTLRMLLGLISPDRGSAQVLGRDYARCRPRPRRRACSTSPAPPGRDGPATCAPAPRSPPCPAGGSSRARGDRIHQFGPTGESAFSTGMRQPHAAWPRRCSASRAAILDGPPPGWIRRIAWLRRFCAAPPPRPHRAAASRAPARCSRRSRRGAHRPRARLWKGRCGAAEDRPPSRTPSCGRPAGRVRHEAALHGEILRVCHPSAPVWTLRPLSWCSGASPGRSLSARRTPAAAPPLDTAEGAASASAACSCSCPRCSRRRGHRRVPPPRSAPPLAVPRRSTVIGASSRYSLSGGWPTGCSLRTPAPPLLGAAVPGDPRPLPSQLLTVWGS